MASRERSLGARRGGAARALVAACGTALASARHRGGGAFTAAEASRCRSRSAPARAGQHPRVAGYAEDGSQRPEGRLGDAVREADRLQGQREDSDTSDETVNLMKTGQYDVVSASGDATLRLIPAATWHRSTPR